MGVWRREPAGADGGVSGGCLAQVTAQVARAFERYNLLGTHAARPCRTASLTAQLELQESRETVEGGRDEVACCVATDIYLLFCRKRPD
jgi:hypothetical protein